MSAPALMTTPEDARAFWLVDILWLVLVTGDETNGEYSLMDQLCPRNSGPPPHTHTQREMFYIMDGQITFIVGDEKITAGSGSFVQVPPNTIHSFRVDSEIARVLNAYTPAGFERLIVESALPAKARTLPPKGLPPKADQETMRRLTAEVGMTNLQLRDTLRDKS